VFGILGRWGNGGEFRIVSEILRELTYQPPASGNTAYIAMRAYPAVLLFYGYGLGALTAGRYGALYQWLTTRISKSQSETTPAVDALFQGAWEAGGNDIWRRLTGLELHKTALSDHLYELFKNWARDFLFADSEITGRFEAFEFLASLAYMTVNASEYELERAQKSQGTINFIWFPFGRIAWDGVVRTKVLAELDEPGNQKLMLDAGFACGQVSYLSLALENANRVFTHHEFRSL
jgi:hypothetical protein